MLTPVSTDGHLCFNRYSCLPSEQLLQWQILHDVLDSGSYFFGDFISGFEEDGVVDVSEDSGDGSVESSFEFDHSKYGEI